MVSTGSSLRAARRPGWEPAYLDYETLKLLLSQIEAVYEEEGHRRQAANSFEEPKKGQGDYRDELFLESDSDAAYASVDDEIDRDADDYSNSTASETGGIIPQGVHRRKLSSKNKAFFMSYSDENSSSEEEDGVKNDGCGAGVSYSLSNWTSWDKQKRDGDNKKQQTKRLGLDVLEDEDAFYMKGSSIPTTNSLAFVFPGDKGNRQEFLNAPVMMHATETSSLLKAPTTPSPYTMPSHAPESTTPPRNIYMGKSGPSRSWATPVAPGDGSIAEATHTSTATPPPKTITTKEKAKQRQHERKQRRLRRRRLRALRRRREKKVPRHLRVAHSKARAIVERFLGLLRSETEKVLLFAQSRLGELADTAGSLRFSSLADQDRTEQPLTSTSAFQYSTLPEGGFNPSGSSSDEEDGDPFGQGGFPWSDSSQDEESSSGSPQDIMARATKAAPQVAIGRTKSRSSTDDAFPSDGSKANILRHIEHFTQLRQRRPVFSSSDQILGEEFLLMSAVEEADGYTTVGIELMHVLRYICVNLLAVKKICKKHDRLLMQRMLGGYYQRTRVHPDAGDRYAHIEDANTLGGLLARVSGDVYDAHPALIGHYSHYKLVGVYDRKIQKLANSRTVQVVSSCLALALSEYEVSRSRADALTKLNSTQSPSRTPKRSGGGGPHNSPETLDLLQPSLSEDEGWEGPPTTESNVSLTRLRFTVTSIFALREAAREKIDQYGAYLSRSMLTFTGRPVRGEGLDGCSRETLDFLVTYNPDSAHLLDTDTLHRGLCRGRWTTVPMSEVMIRTLAASVSVLGVARKPATVAGAVSVDPESRKIVLMRLLKGQKPKSVLERTSFSIPNLPPVAFSLNRVTCFLYQMNYFMVHANVNSFVRSSGVSTAYTSLVIGAPNLAALVAALVHTIFVSNEYSAHRFPSNSVALIRRLFSVSCFFGVVGNVIHGMAVDTGSVPLAVLGRFVFGLSSSEILHRQLVSACAPSHVVAQSARLVYSRYSGLLAGMLLGSLMEIFPFTLRSIGIRWLQTSSWLMVIAWFGLGIGFLASFRVVDFRSRSDIINGTLDAGDLKDGTEAVYDSDSSDSHHRMQSPSFLYQSSSGTPLNSQDPFRELSFGGADNSGHPLEEDASVVEETPYDNRNRSSSFRPIRTFFGRLRKLLRYNVGIPICLFVVLYTNYAIELCLSGTPLITCRYFGWSGVKAGLFLAGLIATIIPLHFVCEFVSRRYEERTVLRRSLQVVLVGLFCTLNFVSLLKLAQRMPNLLSETSGQTVSHPYDWKIGLFQFCVGLPVVFMGLISMQGSALSILSKLSPSKFRSVALHVGTLSVFVGCIARLTGDIQLFFVGLSHRLINTDIINAIAIPLILAGIPTLLILKRYFFYMM